MSPFQCRRTRAFAAALVISFAAAGSPLAAPVEEEIAEASPQDKVVPTQTAIPQPDAPAPTAATAVTADARRAKPRIATARSRSVAGKPKTVARISSKPRVARSVPARQTYMAKARDDFVRSTWSCIFCGRPLILGIGF